jgi:transcription initiation factor TFIIB
MATGFDMAAAAGGFSKKKEFKENLNEVLICPDCRTNPPILNEEFASGDVVCGECGLVLGDRIIDTRSEWRTFANDDQGNDDPSRVGKFFACPGFNATCVQANILD